MFEVLAGWFVAFMLLSAPLALLGALLHAAGGPGVPFDLWIVPAAAVTVTLVILVGVATADVTA